jgi:hypothetical protein
MVRMMSDTKKTAQSVCITRNGPEYPGSFQHVSCPGLAVTLGSIVIIIPPAVPIIAAVVTAPVVVIVVIVIVIVIIVIVIVGTGRMPIAPTRIVFATFRGWPDAWIAPCTDRVVTQDHTIARVEDDFTLQAAPSRQDPDAPQQRLAHRDDVETLRLELADHGPSRGIVLRDGRARGQKGGSRGDKEFAAVRGHAIHFQRITPPATR